MAEGSDEETEGAGMEVVQQARALTCAAETGTEDSRRRKGDQEGGLFVAKWWIGQAELAACACF